MTEKKKSEEGRFCYFIPMGSFIHGRGWRVSIVRENESGHFPTGSWPYSGRPGETLPYFWGDPDNPNDLESAEEVCSKMNERMGLSKQDVVKIVSSSMFARE